MIELGRAISSLEFLHAFASVRAEYFDYVAALRRGGDQGTLWVGADGSEVHGVMRLNLQLDALVGY